MSSPFVAEIRMWPGTYAPRGFAFCNGQLLSISQNVALFSLLGTNYGGNGTSNFGLPNLQASTPLMAGQGNGLSPRSLGQTGGSATVSLNVSQLAAHTHLVNCDNQGGGLSSPLSSLWGATGRGGSNLYTTNTPASPMSPAAITTTGNSLPHNNMSPFLTVYFLIALVGIYPARN